MVKTCKRFGKQTNKTCKQIKGGENSIEIYAQQMKNKEQINVIELKACLEKELNPLKKLYSFDNSENKYTINEWALICGVEANVYDLFCDYEYDLTRRIEYPFDTMYNIKYKNSLLEAYLLKSNHLNSISTMLKQLQRETDVVIENNMFYYWYPESCVPTILKCMFDMITITKSNIYIALSTPILAFYTDINMLNKLTNNKNIKYTSELFYYSITYQSLGLLQLISTQLTSTEIIELVFDEHVVEALLIQDSMELYSNVIMLLNGADINIIGAIICKILNTDCTNENVLKIIKYIDSSNYKKFFEVIGNYAIKKLMIPDIQKNPHIIVICHGISHGPDEYARYFPMRQLCFYAEKGCALNDISNFTRPLEELICAGYYDATLRCKPSSDKTIETENYAFSFKPASVEQEIRKYLGFYLCNNGHVTKINTKLNSDENYSIDFIIERSASIADMWLGDSSNIDLMIYACIGYHNTTKTTNVRPKLTAKN